MAGKPEGIPEWDVSRRTDRFLHYVGNYICQPAWNAAPKDGHLATHVSEKSKISRSEESDHMDGPAGNRLLASWAP